MFPPQAYLNEFDLEDSNGRNRLYFLQEWVYITDGQAPSLCRLSQLRLPVDWLALTLACDSCCAAY